MFVSAIIAAGGRGSRLGAAEPKQLLTLGGRTILQRSVDLALNHDSIAEVIVAVPAELAAAPPGYLRSSRKPLHVVEGGRQRHDSVARAFARVSPDADVILIHDAARPLATPALFSQVIDAAVRHGAAIAALQASDTVKQAAGQDGERTVVRTLARESIYLAQTPQAFRRGVLEDAIAHGRRTDSPATDEASLAEEAGHAVQVVDGEPANIKITTAQDLRVSESLLEAAGTASPGVPRIGTGYDLHRLESGRPLIIGGVAIPHDTGLAGHSDADVLAHAVTDAILGAAAAGDIGRHFPDSDPQWRGADSLTLLAQATQLIATRGLVVSNVDAVIVAERPKLAPYIETMRANLARAMGVEVAAVSVKGKTNERVDALGRNEAIAVHAVALLTHARSFRT